MIIKVVAYNTKFMTKYINLLLLPHWLNVYKNNLRNNNTFTWQHLLNNTILGD